MTNGDEDEDEYVCDLCGESYETEQLYEDHVDDAHGDE